MGPIGPATERQSPILLERVRLSVWVVTASSCPGTGHRIAYVRSAPLVLTETRERAGKKVKGKTSWSSW